ncbi:MAG: hypothetical protein ACOC42_04290 [Halobacteriota archaeon]
MTPTGDTNVAAQNAATDIVGQAPAVHIPDVVTVRRGQIDAYLLRSIHDAITVADEEEVHR